MIQSQLRRIYAGQQHTTSHSKSHEMWIHLIIGINPAYFLTKDGLKRFKTKAQIQAIIPKLCWHRRHSSDAWREKPTNSNCHNKGEHYNNIPGFRFYKIRHWNTDSSQMHHNASDNIKMKSNKVSGDHKPTAKDPHSPEKLHWSQHMNQLTIERTASNPWLW